MKAPGPGPLVRTAVTPALAWIGRMFTEGCRSAAFDAVVVMRRAAQAATSPADLTRFIFCIRISGRLWLISMFSDLRFIFLPFRSLLFPQMTRIRDVDSPPIAMFLGKPGHTNATSAKASAHSAEESCSRLVGSRRAFLSRLIWRLVPIETQFCKLLANSPQIPDMK